MMLHISMIELLFYMSVFFLFFFFKHKTADDMRISDWSSDVCSSDLTLHQCPHPSARLEGPRRARAHPALPAQRSLPGATRRPRPGGRVEASGDAGEDRKSVV